MRGSAQVLLGWLFTALLAGCGPSGGQLALQLKVARQAPGDGPRAGPPEGIDAFRLCVQKPTGLKVLCQDFFDLQVSKVRMDGIPAGKNRTVTFQGYAQDAATGQTEVLWCGRAVGIHIRDDAVTPVRMLLTPCRNLCQTPAPPGEPRVFHTATRAPDGAVILLGGYSRFEGTALLATGSAERYDPYDGTFTPLPGGLANPRGFHAALPLRDGRILVAGGCLQIGVRLESSDPDRPGSPLGCQDPGRAATTWEIYDPQSGNSESGQMPAAIFAGAVSLPGERLLLIGGLDLDGNPQRSVLVVDASGGVSEHPGALMQPRSSPTAVLFSQDDDPTAGILVVGGAGAAGPSDPGTYAEWLVAGGGQVFSLVPKFVSDGSGAGLPVMHAAGSRLQPGRVLVTGGVYPQRFLSQDVPFIPEPLEEAGLADMRVESLALLPAEERLSVPRAFHTCSTVGESGSALVVGGLTATDRDLPLHHRAAASVEWWDPQAQGFSPIWRHGNQIFLLHPRAGHSATRLADGTVLLVGGTDGATLHQTAELFNPSPADLGQDGLPPP